MLEIRKVSKADFDGNPKFDFDDGSRVNDRHCRPAMALLYRG